VKAQFVRQHQLEKTMKTPRKTLLWLSLALCACTATALAAPASVMVSDCWIRMLPGNLPSGGYFSVMNMSDKPVDLTGVETDAFGMAMLHQTQSNASTSKMVMVEKATVPANGTLKFAPGRYHVMLEEPKQPVKVGTSIRLTFSFSDGEKVTSECVVKNAGATSD
jgi:periplasmic copper chaperone A